jgi:hypothetical protein
MENFKKFLSEKKDDVELENFMKNSKIDLLKSIAKRFKLSISGKNKSQMIAMIKQAVNANKPFLDEPSLAQMSVAQLKNKAIELNIDISGLKVKQALRVAILNKMNSSPPTITEQGVSSSTSQSLASTMQNYDELKNKSLSYLKALAKQFKIKISKLSKEQLITSILEKTSATGTAPVLQAIDAGSKTTSDLLKLSKNVLEAKATELGYVSTDANGKKKKTTKKDLVEYITSSSSSSTPVVVQVEAKKKKESPNLTFPLSESDLAVLKKTLTIVKIKEYLKTHNIKIPKGVIKKEDLLPLLLKIQPSSPTTTSNVVPTSTAPTTSAVAEAEPEVDVVSLDDISSPFVPADIRDLTEAPTDDQLREDVIRCLKFYDYPS